MTFLYKHFTPTLLRVLAVVVFSTMTIATVAPDPANALGFRVRGGGFSLSVGQGDLESEITAQLDPVEKVYGGADEQSLGVTIANIIRAVLGLVGILFVGLMVYAGFMWMTAAGNEDQVSRARKIIVAAIIGVAIIIFAFIITNFVIDSLVRAADN